MSAMSRNTLVYLALILSFCTGFGAVAEDDSAALRRPFVTKVNNPKLPKSMIGGPGYVGTIVLNGYIGLWGLECQDSYMPAPCIVENKTGHEILAGLSGAAVVVNDNAVWRIVNEEGAVISSEVERNATVPAQESCSKETCQHSIAIHLRSGKGQSLITNNGLITTPRIAGDDSNNARYVGTAIYIGQRNAGWLGNYLTVLSLKNNNVMRAGVILDSRSEGFVKIANSGVMQGDIYFPKHIGSNRITLTGSGELYGDVVNVDQLVIDNGEERRNGSGTDAELATVHLQGHFIFANADGQPRAMKITKHSAIAIHGIEVVNGDILGEPNVSLHFSSVDGDGRGETPLLDISNHRIQLEDANVYLEMNDTEASEQFEFLLIRAADLDMPSVNVELRGEFAHAYQVKSVLRDQNTLRAIVVRRQG